MNEIIDKIKKDIYISFKLYLDKEIKNEQSVNNILNKGKEIIEKFESLDSKIDRKILLTGKVQSGKTVNFLSVIANAFSLSKNYEIIFVLSSIEKKLHKQTVDRIKDAFDYKKNNNYLKIFDLNEDNIRDQFKKNNAQIIADENRKGKFLILTLLKNPSNLDMIKNFFSLQKLQDKKILIIDDEGDLASFSRDKKNNEAMKTLQSIKELFNSLNHSSYLSVTATPQIQYLTPKSEEMIPRKVFCVDPGNGYHGLETFTNEKYYKIVKKPSNKESKNLEYDLLWESLIYYAICWANYLHEYNIDEWYKKHSNFLIHTDVKTKEHEDVKKIIEDYLIDFKNYFNNKNTDKDYWETIIISFRKLVNEYKLKDFLDDNEYLNKLAWCFNTMEVKVINQKTHNELNDSFATINIGSRKLERGITLDNLIATYFTNRSDKSTTAIDTLLQRARWFGYRNNILDYVKIFTTDLVKQNFIEIKKIDDIFWQNLKNAEKEDLWFNEMDREIILKKESKLIPTSKARLKNIRNKNQSTLFINQLKEESKNFISLYDKLWNSNDRLVINDSNIFKCISFNNIISFFEEFPNLKNLLFDEKISFDELKNLKLRVCLVDNDGEPRKRGCQKINNEYQIKQLFQGRSSAYKEGLENTQYAGDANWYKHNPNWKDDLFLQIHYLDVFDDSGEKELKLNDSPIFAWALLVPEQFCTFKSYEINDD